ncbi:MAG: hypothetical protein M9894_35675 [Planctomycetes bacterium]|nr:hypothetical protein [Planctomycetota bacterium]
MEAPRLRPTDAGDGARRCPLCRDALAPGGPVEECAGCGTGYHPACRRELSRCATLGCGEAAAPPRPRAPRRRPPWEPAPDEIHQLPADDEDDPPRPRRQPGLFELIARAILASPGPWLGAALLAAGITLGLLGEAQALRVPLVLLGVILLTGAHGRRAR